MKNSHITTLQLWVIQGLVVTQKLRVSMKGKNIMGTCVRIPPFNVIIYFWQ